MEHPAVRVELKSARLATSSFLAHVPVKLIIASHDSLFDLVMEIIVERRGTVIKNLGFVALVEHKAVGALRAFENSPALDDLH
jgi:hypothetical protein